MDYSTPGLPALYRLPEFVQVHVHCSGDAIQPSHGLSLSSPAFSLSQHQDLFQWVGCSQPTQLAVSNAGCNQSVGASASVSALPMSIQGWFPLRLTSLISLLFKGLSKVSSASLKASILLGSAFFMVQFSQVYMTTEKTVALTIWTFVSKVMSLLFNTVGVCHNFPAKKQLSSNFMATITICSDFRAQEEEIRHCSYLFPFCLPWSDRAGCHDPSFWIFSFKPALSLFSLFKGSFVSLGFLPLEWYHLHI